jgi:nucleoside-triphosphatase THEP1
MDMAWGRILLVSGQSGCGKTAFCTRFLHGLPETIRNSWRIRGILSPPLMRGGERCGIIAVNLETNERRHFAAHNRSKAGGIHTASWRFDPRTLRWCNEVLAAAVPCDLLIIDELGPLEFEQDRGCLEGLKAVDTGQFQLAVVVVRTRLIERALERWPSADRIDLSQGGWDAQLPERLRYLVNIA